MAKAKVKTKVEIPEAPPMPKMALVVKEAQALTADTQKALDYVRRMEVRTMPEAQHAVGVVREIKGEMAKADGLRRRWVDPLNAVVKDINGFFKDGTAHLDAAEEMGKDKIAACVIGLRGAADEVLRQVKEAVAAGDQPKADALMRKAAEIEPGKLEGVSFREEWDVEITDPAQIPAAYRVPDAKALKAAAKAAKGDPGIPGCKAVKRIVVAISAEGGES